MLDTIAQLLLAYFLFMVVVFSAGGIANGMTLGRLQLGILNLSVFVLPGLCVLSAAIVVFQHLRAGSAASYWWYAMPLAATALYLAYAVWLGRQG